MRFRNYRNKHTNDNKIYSVENIQNMTVKDAFSRKQELLAQNRSIGVPTEDELKNSSNAVWVDDFVRDDGTKVRGHWRSKPEDGIDGYSEDGQNSSNDSMTGGATPADDSLNGNVSNSGNILNVDEPDYFAENMGDYNGDLDELDYGIGYGNNSKLLTGGVKMDNYLDSAVGTTPVETTPAKVTQAEVTQAENALSKSMPAVKSTAPAKPNNSNTGIPTFHDTTAAEKLYYLNKLVGHIAEQEKQKAKNYAQEIREDTQANAAKSPIWTFTPAQYYGHALRLAEGKEPSIFMKKNNIFTKLSDLPNNELKSYYIDKVKGSVPDYYKKYNDIQMVVAKKDSQLHNQVKNSATLQNWIVKNYDKANGRIVGQSLEFPRSKDVKNGGLALYATVHNADVTYAKKYPDGSMLVVLCDTFDFENWDLSTLDGFDKAVGYINNVADSQQKKGKLHPYLLTIPIFLSKEEVEAMKNKY